jgi:hypothetical protein
MKTLILPLIAATTLVMTGCNSMKSEAMVAQDGVVKTVTVKPIKSFMVEISPRAAVCNNPAMNNMCLQYRNQHARNFEPLKTIIEGFNFETGNRYILDVRQDVVEKDGMMQSKWVLNEVVKKTLEPLSN